MRDSAFEERRLLRWGALPHHLQRPLTLLPLDSWRIVLVVGLQLEVMSAHIPGEEWVGLPGPLP